MRHIRLPIDATETHCDDCDALDSDVLVCRVFDAEPVWRGGDLARLPECLAAEAADKALERDAALGSFVRSDVQRIERFPGHSQIGRALVLWECIQTHLRTEET